MGKLDKKLQIEMEKCLVCNRQGLKLAVNYNVKSCQKCKAFFFRNYNKDVCKRINCGVKNCKGCRLAICLKAGMKKEFLRQNSKKGGRRSKLELHNIEMEMLTLSKEQLLSKLSQLQKGLNIGLSYIESEMKVHKENARIKEMSYEFDEALVDYQFICKFAADEYAKEKVEKIRQIIMDMCNFKLTLISMLVNNEKCGKMMYDDVLNLAETLTRKYAQENNVQEAILKEEVTFILENLPVNDEKSIELIEKYLDQNNVIDRPWFLISLSKFHSRMQNYIKAEKCYEESVKLINMAYFTKVDLKTEQLKFDKLLDSIKSEEQEEEKEFKESLIMPTVKEEVVEIV